MKYLLQALGFSDFNDLLGTFYFLFPKLLSFSLYTSAIVGFIEAYTGISFMFWLFMLLASIFDLALGFYANVIVLKNPVESAKAFRGIVKMFILMTIVFLTNTFKVGVETSIITPKVIHDFAIYAVDTIHYTSVLLIGLYILLGIAENGAKVEIAFCVSLVKILKMRINNIENKNNDEPDDRQGHHNID